MRHQNDFGPIACALGVAEGGYYILRKRTANLDFILQRYLLNDTSPPLYIIHILTFCLDTIHFQMTLCAYECSFYFISFTFELIQESSIDYIVTYLSMKRDQAHN